MHITIRRINQTEGHLAAKLFDSYRVLYKQPSDIQLAKEYLQARLDHSESVIFVAFEGDSYSPIGFTQLYPTYSFLRVVKNWILNDLYVDPSHRKKELAKN